MAQLNGLPIYYIKIKEGLDSNTGIDFISLVDCPAIETNWVAMGDNKSPMKFSLNEDKQLLNGPILIPDLPIYRFDKDMGEYYVVFTAEEIQKLVRKFQASQKTINLNYQHKKDSQLSSAVVQEIWLTGKSDKSKDMGFDLPVNSAFVVTHVGDKKFWDEEVKTGNVRGFSIEGFLDMEMKKQIKHKMSNIKLEATAKTNDGKTLKTPADGMYEGVDLMIVAEDGTESMCPDGDYTLESGEVVTVLGGKITAITEVELNDAEKAIIQDAMSTVVAELRAEIKANQTKIAELELKIENKPAAASATSSTDTPKPGAVKMSVIQSTKSKLEFLRKADKALPSNNEKK